MIKHSAVVAVVAGMRAFLSQVCAQRCACHGQHASCSSQDLRAGLVNFMWARHARAACIKVRLRRGRFVRLLSVHDPGRATVCRVFREV